MNKLELVQIFYMVSYLIHLLTPSWSGCNATVTPGPGYFSPQERFVGMKHHNQKTIFT